ncbi:MAG: M14 family metallopeptidase [Bacteroidota bacterium]
MKKLRLTIYLALFMSPLFLSAQNIQSPEDFLGYPLGEKFTWHHQVVSYFEYVGDNSDKVLVQQYGESNEGRKLLTAIISSKKNMDRLEEIRTDHLKSIGLMEGEAEGKVPIVYMSYNIHGNEASATEAAIATLYQLVTHDTANWLEDMVVILDPCINPDGRDRYVNWYKQARNKVPNPNGSTWEHREPWPGGRYNHYIFDLNRDWAWQTQKESQEKAVRYQEWMPHVHIDFHEMGANSPYFFAPPSKPIHKLTTDWQKEFHEALGKNHASYFNREGWLYFTKEVFDLFYPSYGDTWPSFQGAIGLTYEQGGGGRGGLGIEINNGTELKLSDRIAHHYTTSLSTIETAFKNKDRMVDEFVKYFDEARNNPFGEYKAYVIKADNDASRLDALQTLLDRNQIQYAYPANSANRLQGYSFMDNENQVFELESNDLVISTFQAQSRLVQALFEPKPEIEDSITYDLTAWAMPFAYGLEAYATPSKIALSEREVQHSQARTAVNGKVYAFVAEWEDISDVALLAALAKEGIKSRFASQPFSLGGKTFERGTLIITRADNPQADFVEKAQRIAANLGKVLQITQNGQVEKGKDFGSRSVSLIGIPKVALVNGEGISPTAFGNLWYYFEEDINYPVDVLNTQFLRGVNLSEYDVLVLPSGSYGRFKEQILEFVREGGKVIALQRSIGIFSRFGKDEQGTALSSALAAYREKEAKEEAKEVAAAEPESKLNRYEDQVKEYVTESAPGSVYEVSLDDSHPLAFGLGSKIHLIKQSSSIYPYMNDGWNVGAYKSATAVSGFTGAKLEEKIANTLAFGSESLGRGTIVYFPEDPNFRSFWHVGKLLLGNAVFMRF